MVVCIYTAAATRHGQVRRKRDWDGLVYIGHQPPPNEWYKIEIRNIKLRKKKITEQYTQLCFMFIFNYELVLFLTSTNTWTNIFLNLNVVPKLSLLLFLLHFSYSICLNSTLPSEWSVHEVVSSSFPSCFGSNFFITFRFPFCWLISDWLCHPLHVAIPYLSRKCRIISVVLWLCLPQ